MPRKLLDRTTMAQYLERIEALRPDTKPQWGKLDATGMVAHLTQSFRISLGEVPVTDRSNWFLRRFGVIMAFGPLPIPRNVTGPAEFFPKSVAEFEEEKRAWREAMERFVAAAESDPDRKHVSPLMGPLPLRTWQRIHAVHMDHHFKQFGLN